MGSSMSNPFDFRDIMKAHMRYGETRTVDQVLADHKARDEAQSRGGRPTVSKTPPDLGRSATADELNAARLLLGAAKPNNVAVQE